MKKILLTNLVYGDIYSDLFLNQHLKSLLDETNIPAFKNRLEYIVFTDSKTAVKIRSHKNFEILSLLVSTDIVEMIPSNFEGRYSSLVTMFKESVKIALEQNQYLSAMVADLVVAKNYIPKLFKRLDAGFDSVFVLPLRSAADAMVPHLNKSEGALPEVELCLLGYENLHPLWVACHWHSPQFTKLPFTLLWNSGTGLLARSFSITPIVLTPKEAMLKASGVIDVEIPHMCENPFWARDWIDCPVIGVEPLFCYYPPFTNVRADVVTLGKNWTKCLHPTQIDYLSESLYYPSKELVGLSFSAKVNSDNVVEMITGIAKGKQ